MGVVRRGVVHGLVAGAAGVAAMTVAEQVEQRFTGQPGSHVPGRVLERLLHLPEAPREQLWPVSWTMHWGQGALVGSCAG